MELKKASYNCPNCKSENTKKFSLVYEEGNFLSHSKGTIQSSLSRRFEPPKIDEEWECGFGLIGFIFFVLTIISLCYVKEDPCNLFGVLIFGFLHILSMLKWNKSTDEWTKRTTEKLHSETEIYNKKYICLRCGYEFSIQ